MSWGRGPAGAAGFAGQLVLANGFMFVDGKGRLGRVRQGKEGKAMEVNRKPFGPVRPVHPVFTLCQ